MQTKQKKQQIRCESLSLRKDKDSMQLPRFYSKPKNELKKVIQVPKNYIFNSRVVKPFSNVINVGQQLQFARKSQLSERKTQKRQSDYHKKPYSLKKLDATPIMTPSLIKYSNKKSKLISSKEQPLNSNKSSSKFSKINFRTKSKTKQTEICAEEYKQKQEHNKLCIHKKQRTVSTCNQQIKEQKKSKQLIKDTLIEDEVMEGLTEIDKDVWIRIQQLLKNMSRSVSDIKSAEEYIVSERLKYQKRVYSKIKDMRIKNRLKIHLALTRIAIYLYAHLMINGMDVKITLSIIDKLHQSHKQTGSLLLQGIKIKKIGEWIIYISRNNEYAQQSLETIFSRKRLPHNQLFRNMLQTSLKIESIEYLGVIDKTLKWQILKMPSYPFLPHSERSHNLILDLDETLIHFNSKSETFHVRPYAQQFITKLSKYFEITIFTAATKDYADEIINEIDPKNNISFRLYRNHLTFKEDTPTKDISMLGRPLQKTVLVDNLASNLLTHPQNGILIKSWYGDDEKDDILNKLCSILIKIVQNYQEDLRIGIRQFSQFISQEITVPDIIYELKQSL